MRRLLIILLLFYVPPIFASYDTAGTTSAEFLKIPGNARAAALGGNLSIIDDVNSLVINPAITGFIRKKVVGLNYISFFQGVQYFNLNVAYPFDKIGTFGFGFIYLTSGDLPITVDSPESVGTISKNDFSVVVDYSKNIGDFIPNRDFKKLYGGVGLKFLREALGDYHNEGMVIDLGAYWDTPVKNLYTGFSLLNLALLNNNKYSGLPANLKIGAKYDFSFYNLNYFNEDMSAIIDFDKTSGMMLNIISGVEARFFDIVTIRFGYRLLHDTGGFSTGIGLSYNGAEISYSFAPYSVLGYDHQFSLKYGIGYKPAVKKVNLYYIHKAKIDVFAKPYCFSLINKNNIKFDIKVKTQRPILNWSLKIGNEDMDLVYKKFSGKDKPPATIIWNGLDDKGHYLKQGEYYYPKIPQIYNYDFSSLV